MREKVVDRREDGFTPPPTPGRDQAEASRQDRPYVVVNSKTTNAAGGVVKFEHSADQWLHRCPAMLNVSGCCLGAHSAIIHFGSWQQNENIIPNLFEVANCTNSAVVNVSGCIHRFPELK